MKAFAQKVRSMDFGPREFSHEHSKKHGSVLNISHREIISTPKTASIKHAADKMAANRVRRLFITDAKKKLEGVVSATDIVDFIGGGELNKIVKNKHNGFLEIAANEHVRLIMSEKVKSIPANSSMKDALIKMYTENVGALPIVDNDRVVGVVTERDFIPLISKYYFNAKVSDYMSREVVTGTDGMTIGDVAKVMIRNGFRRLPIIQEDELVGIVATIDIVRAFSENPRSDLLETQISKIMNRPITISPDELVSNAADLMDRSSVGGLTVVKGNKLVGVITERDLLKAVSV